jgi:hypothetical protein
MANHVRQQIREAAAGLLNGLATTGSNVFQSRVYALADDELPGLVVITNREAVSTIDGGINPALMRSLELVVIAKAKLTTNLDDKLDTIIKEVEAALNSSVTANTLGGLVKGIDLASIDIEMNGDNEKPVGQATMTFNAAYYTQASAPDVSI